MHSPRRERRVTSVDVCGPSASAPDLKYFRIYGRDQHHHDRVLCQFFIDTMFALHLSAFVNTTPINLTMPPHD